MWPIGCSLTWKKCKSPKYRTFTVVTYAHKPKERLMTMFTMRYVRGHIQVYDHRGKFLFSADNEREAREELKDYEEFAA